MAAGGGSGSRNGTEAVASNGGPSIMQEIPVTVVGPNVGPYMLREEEYSRVRWRKERKADVVTATDGTVNKSCKPSAGELSSPLDTNVRRTQQV